MNKTAFAELWDGEDMVGLFDEVLPEQSRFCPYAQRFSEWTNGLLTSVSQETTVVSVNQAKLLLQDKWHDWRTVSPKLHRNHLTNRGHICIFQVYEQAYHQLRVLELSLTPPLLFLPPAPKPQLPRLFLGEEK